MADRKLFYEDAGLTRVDTEVVERGTSDGGAWVRLAETVFYPEGGGQPADRGTIAGIPVTAVRSRGAEVLHFVAEPPATDRVEARLDAGWRFEMRQQHTAQHLLTAVLADRHALPTTSFHLGERYTAIEVASAPPSDAQLRAFEDEVNAHIREDRPVRTSWVEPADLAALAVRSRGLPEGHSGRVRIVEIEGLDRNTCGGTHVDRLAEIQMIVLQGAEAARGGARIRFLAGVRVAREAEAQRRLESALKARLGTGPEEFVQALDAKDAARRTLERRVRDLEDAVAESLAAEIARDPGALRVRHLAGAGPDMLRAVAGKVAKIDARAALVLVGTHGNPEEACYVVQAAPEAAERVARWSARLDEALAARGGGKGGFRQGRGGRWSGSEAFEKLARSLAEEP